MSAGDGTRPGIDGSTDLRGLRRGIERSRPGRIGMPRPLERHRLARPLTTSPAYIVSMRVQVSAMTPRSWVMKHQRRAGAGAEVEQQVDDLRLDGDVERRAIRN